MVTEEELSQMSPEELADFQKQNCVFCQISSGRVPAKEVYSDEESIAVLDINPAAKGHILLMPKEHFSVMPQLPEELAEHLFMVTKGLSQAALKGLQCKGTTIFIANGVAAGQRAPHFMIHIIPRNDSDNIRMAVPSRPFDKKDMDAVAGVLKKVVAKKLAAEAEVVGDNPAKEQKDGKPKTGKPKASDKPAKTAANKLKKTAKKKKKGSSDAENPGPFDLDSLTGVLADGKV
ncbi:HIT domain-containing protein [Candidatus Woesearchaeota archaeon]|nr:HIT domain-containing protein [Candidatus Woesearchaeota archaeon]